jgi:hypothetical protein
MNESTLHFGGGLLRVALLFIGYWQDFHPVIKYTDVCIAAQYRLTILFLQMPQEAFQWVCLLIREIHTDILRFLLG